MYFRRAVIGIDFSDDSRAAAAWTMRHFAPGADVVLVHVSDSSRSAEPGDAIAGDPESRLRRLRDELNVPRAATETASGDIAVELARIAREREADLIAVGKLGVGRSSRLLGSTAETLVLNSLIPVLLAAGVHDRQPASILAAMHDDQSRQRVLQWARALSEHFDAACVALAIVNGEVRTHLISMAALAARGGGVASHELDGACLEAAPWVAELTAMPDSTDPHTPASTVDTAQHVVTAAKQLHSDLVVAGSSGFAAAVADPVVSVACEIARESPCPVLVVKPQSPEPPAAS
jgi:nucleotide-binding universal stress UspA family protein